MTIMKKDNNEMTNLCMISVSESSINRMDVVFSVTVNGNELRVSSEDIDIDTVEAIEEGEITTEVYEVVEDCIVMGTYTVTKKYIEPLSDEILALIDKMADSIVESGNGMKLLKHWGKV